MKADSLIRWLMPKENHFQGLLAESTANLKEAARVFAEIARVGNLEERRVKVVSLKALEHAGDEITRRTFEALNRTFITPLDREDIRALASDLDDVLDHVEGVAQYLVLFELSDSPEALRQFAQIICGMAEQVSLMSRLVWDLAHAREIQAAIVRVSELENQGDALYNTVIADLFKKMCHDSVEIMKWKEVYDGLEEACDACKDFSHVVGNIVLKNA
jgi:uncharacterized protein